MAAPAESFETQRARLAAHSMHATHDSRKVSQPARDRFMGRFERNVREAAAAKGEKLTEAEVARRAEHAKKAYFARLALKSAKARRKKASARARKKK